MLHNVILRIVQVSCHLVLVQVNRSLCFNKSKISVGLPSFQGTFTWIFPPDLEEGSKIYIFAEGTGMLQVTEIF